MSLSTALVPYGIAQMSYAELLWVDYLGMYIRSEVAGKEAEVVRVPFYRWAGGEQLAGGGCGGRGGAREESLGPRQGPQVLRTEIAAVCGVCVGGGGAGGKGEEVTISNGTEAQHVLQ